MKPNKAAPASDAGAVAADSGSVLRPPNRDELITKLNSMNPGDDVAKTTAIDLSGILEVAPNRIHCVTRHVANWHCSR